MTVFVEGVRFTNVLIKSGATYNLLGQGTWDWLKSQKIQHQTVRENNIPIFP